MAFNSEEAAFWADHERMQRTLEEDILVTEWFDQMMPEWRTEQVHPEDRREVSYWDMPAWEVSSVE